MIAFFDAELIPLLVFSPTFFSLFNLLKFHTSVSLICQAFTPAIMFGWMKNKKKKGKAKTKKPQGLTTLACKDFCSGTTPYFPPHKSLNTYQYFPCLISAAPAAQPEPAPAAGVVSFDMCVRPPIFDTTCPSIIPETGFSFVGDGGGENAGDS